MEQVAGRKQHSANAKRSASVRTIFVASGNWSAIGPLQLGGDGEHFGAGGKPLL
jgi:hypothetical protein